MPKGQKPKPKQIKVAEGNRRKVGQASIPDEPRGIGAPRVPAHLTADERRLWADIVGSLPVGLLSRADDFILERMAVATVRYREATRKIAATGILVSSPQGDIRNPLLVVQNIAAKEMHAAGSELGLSPVARARLAAPTAGDDDPMALLLGMDGENAWPPAPRTRQ